LRTKSLPLTPIIIIKAPKKGQEEKLDAYLPDLKFRSRDRRFAAQGRYQPKKGKKFVLQDFRHDEVKDQYICPNGKILKLNIKKHIIDRNIYRRYSSHFFSAIYRLCELNRYCTIRL
jgi:hypothetical protein